MALGGISRVLAASVGCPRTPTRARERIAYYYSNLTIRECNGRLIAEFSKESH